MADEYRTIKSQVEQRVKEEWAVCQLDDILDVLGVMERSPKLIKKEAKELFEKHFTEIENGSLISVNELLKRLGEVGCTGLQNTYVVLNLLSSRSSVSSCMSGDRSY